MEDTNNSVGNSQQQAEESYLGSVAWVHQPARVPSGQELYKLATDDQGQITATKNMLDNLGYDTILPTPTYFGGGNAGVTRGAAGRLSVSVETMQKMKDNMPNLRVLDGPVAENNQGQSAVR